MKSKISCFDAGIARNLARRFWPLWAVYFAAMVVAFPLELTSVAIYSYAQANARVLECAMQSVRVAIPAGAAMAMAMLAAERLRETNRTTVKTTNTTSERNACEMPAR